MIKKKKNPLRIKETYFKGEKKVCTNELERVFLYLGNVKKNKIYNNKKHKKVKDFNNEDVVTLTLLYFWSMFCLGKK